MYPEEEVDAKLQAEKAYYGEKASPPCEPYPQGMCGGTAQGVTPTRAPHSLQEEATSRARHHHEESGKAQSAALFFSQNPSFEDFIRLVRSGAIQF